MNCPCGSNKSFGVCCEPLLLGKQKAITAEALMRSRYTAFTQNEMDYIALTNDPKTRKEIDVEANEVWARESKWLGLEILKCEGGRDTDTEGTVEFIANYEYLDEKRKHHELASFKKIKDEWFFIKGKELTIQTFVRKEEKVGRNDPCSCGSGKKFKKCCGAEA